MELLQPRGQGHLLRFWDELPDEKKSCLAEQIRSIDWDQLDELIQSHVLQNPEISLPENLEPAPYYSSHPHTKEQQHYYRKAAKTGQKQLKEGRVAAFTVAGGQGTRLGFEGPKGTYPIAPLTGKSLFQLFAELLDGVQKKYKTVIPWYIMTSPANHEDTIGFFEQHDFFGLQREKVSFIQQGTMPALDFDGKVLLEDKDTISLSPNGHGGALEALYKSGALEQMRRNGIDYITYWQVDNPLVQPFERTFIGLHELDQSEMSCRSITKTGPFEKLGNFCIADGKVFVIEYSDMPANLARTQDSSGRLRFRQGSPAIHIFNRSFVEQLTATGRLSLPFHRAEKKVKHIDETGNLIKPAENNAVKLEMFIFDALPEAGQVVIYEAERNEHFAPVKNATGQDSIESCRILLQNRAAKWLENAGISIPRDENGKLDCSLELSPARYPEAEDVIADCDNLAPPKRGEEKVYE